MRSPFNSLPNFPTSYLGFTSTLREPDPLPRRSAPMRNACGYAVLQPIGKLNWTTSTYSSINHKTVAFALADNPLGTAAWIVEKLKSWSDSGDNLDSALTKDQVLADIMWYLVTRTEGSGVWFYRGNADEFAAPRGKSSVPTGFAAFPKEMPPLAPPHSMLEREFNLVHYTKLARGGHFACFEQPQLFVEDLRVFFRIFRT